MEDEKYLFHAWICPNDRLIELPPRTVAQMWSGGCEYEPTQEPESQKAGEEANVEEDDLDPGKRRPAEAAAFFRIVEKKTDPLLQWSIVWFASCIKSNVVIRAFVWNCCLVIANSFFLHTDFKCSMCYVYFKISVKI